MPGVVHPILFFSAFLAFPVGFVLLMSLRRRLSRQKTFVTSDVIWHLIPFLMVIGLLLPVAAIVLR